MNLSRIVTYLLARRDIRAWQAARTTEQHTLAPGADSLPADLVPTVISGDRRDRVLAEFDQHGALVASDPRDAAIFGQAGRHVERHHHRVQVVLTGGHVRVRKQRILPSPAGVRNRLRARIGGALEAASLIRLAGQVPVPALRDFDAGTGTVELDYIWGNDVRRELAAHDGTTDEDELARRFARLVHGGDPVFAGWIRAVGATTVRCGVAPLDMHAGNVLRGGRTGGFHLVDFNLVVLRPAPGWSAAVRGFARLCGLEPGGDIR
ncbi:MAG: hypothetical protein IT355_04380 [Gemmatimonadaceae bacterium]|nr:hypothetical protein [Gemmatimonadaceae bacterium]